MKIFLSHSSTDKTIVRKVYEELGAALCHFDEATFSPTGLISEEIYRALSESTHFVFFASPSALSSEWVQGELERAFESWMRSGVRRAIVFLLDGAAVPDLPVWLRQFVMREPPTYRHILCRIQSEIDKETHEKKRPPFYRHAELKNLERLLLVESNQMPGAVLLHGPDGSGRKELVNEIYARQFPFVSKRKLLISASTFITESELYRDVIGLTTIATPSEFSLLFREFDTLNLPQRIAELANKIEECTRGGQVLLLEGDHALFTEEGRLPDWLADLIFSLSGKDYPRLAITTLRRPLNVPIRLIEKLLTQDLPALDKDDSKILFNWWLKTLNQPYAELLKDVVYEACLGSPKQLELGAKLLVAEGSGSVARIKPHLLSSIEGLSRQFLHGLSNSELNSTLLAFVANAGYIVRSDLSQYIVDAGIAPYDSVNDAIFLCSSYGFLIEDEVCLRMPNYLVRGARAIGREPAIAANLKKLFELQSNVASALALDELTSVPLLNEYCINLLRRGENVGAFFESIILPSQCVQVARSMYENENYEETIVLCERAFGSRAALSKDGLVEALRYMGMAAARLARDEDFRLVTERFGDVSDSVRATRIENFLKGFRKRLDGKLDEARAFLDAAYKSKGEFDIHVLRELASVTLNMDDIPAARKYIRAAFGRAQSNQYVIEMAVRVELAASPADVAKRAVEIDRLLESLFTFDHSPDKIYWVVLKADHFLALNEPVAAEEFLNSQPVGSRSTPSLELLRARIAIKKKSFVKAQDLLMELYRKTKLLKTGQRQSTLPIICKDLINACSANSVAEGVEWFETCKPYLPIRIRRPLAQDLLSSAVHTQTKLSSTQMQMLNQATTI